MRTLERNKQDMFYSLLVESEIIYETDDDGNIIYIVVDGERVPVEKGETLPGYREVVPFLGNIALSGGETEAQEYGLSVGDYAAVLVVNKGLLPITETSRIWHTSEPKYNADGTVDKESADYIVKKLSPSINVDKYALQAVVK